MFIYEEDITLGPWEESRSRGSSASGAGTYGRPAPNVKSSPVSAQSARARTGTCPESLVLRINRECRSSGLRLPIGGETLKRRGPTVRACPDDLGFAQRADDGPSRLVCDSLGFNKPDPGSNE